MTEQLKIKQIKLKTFRFIYSNYFSKELEYFSKIHEFDERKAFKNAWTSWIKETDIDEQIEQEIKNTINQGYMGDRDDIMDKMFKSARYYYRKKQKKETKKENETEDNNFSGLSKDMMRIMDNHIIIIIRKYIDEKTAISHVNPAIAFDNFCKTNIKEITDEIFKLKEKILLEPEKMNIKFKKSYKNRFYKIRKLHF